jgi:hypothetical protein
MEVKETKELLKGLLKLSALLGESFKDGVQAQDLAVIFAKIQSDEVLKATLIAAYNDANLVQDELKDLSLIEGLELVKIVIEEAPALIKAVIDDFSNLFGIPAWFTIGILAIIIIAVLGAIFYAITGRIW